MLSEIGEENTASLIEFKALAGKASGAESALLKEVLENGECFKLSAMKLSGNDLAALGISGRKTGEILKLALDSVMKGETPNERSALLEFAVKLK